MVELYGQYGHSNLEIVQHCMVYSKYEPGEMWTYTLWLYWEICPAEVYFLLSINLLIILLK